MPLRRMFWIVAALAVGAFFIPLRSLDSPAWDVWVTDQRGQPVSGMTVRLSYRNYSAESESHEIDAITDTYGHVVFGAQMLTASLGRRAVVALLSATAGVHSSFGSHATVVAFGRGLQGFDVDKERNLVVDWSGKPDHMESRIVVAPRKL
jgi:hypothetical protein